MGLRLLGWVYITPETFKQMGLSPETAAQVAAQELRELENWANGTVYAVALQRPGEHDLLAGPIYTDNGAPPCAEELDDYLRSRGDLTPSEEDALGNAQWAKVVRTINWEQIHPPE